MRAEIGYALSSDELGLGRFRDKYAAKMASTPDAHNFQIVSAPLASSGDEFAAVARAAASADTLETFLREMKSRYPDFERGVAGCRTAPPAAKRVNGAAAGTAARGARPRPAAARQRRGPHRDAVASLPPRDSGEGRPRSRAVGGARAATIILERQRSVESDAPSTTLSHSRRFASAYHQGRVRIFLPGFCSAQSRLLGMARFCALRLELKAWMAGTSPAMTIK